MGGGGYEQNGIRRAPWCPDCCLALHTKALRWLSQRVLPFPIMSPLIALNRRCNAINTTRRAGARKSTYSIGPAFPGSRLPCRRISTTWVTPAPQPKIARTSTAGSQEIVPPEAQEPEGPDRYAGETHLHLEGIPRRPADESGERISGEDMHGPAHYPPDSVRGDMAKREEATMGGATAAPEH